MSQHSFLSKNSISPKNTPKDPQFFKKRVCVAYANDLNSKYTIFQNLQKKDYLLQNQFYVLKRKGSNKCDGCQKSQSNHPRNSPNNKWDYKTCTVLETTDAYSHSKRMLKFNGFKSKSAKVLIRYEFILKFNF